MLSDCPKFETVKGKSRSPRKIWW